MRGECDYLDSGIAAEYLRELPQAKLLEFARSGHALLEEQPDDVIVAIQRFLG
jgi:pimeloyl-ACP methyl ester carboxylesterase